MKDINLKPLGCPAGKTNLGRTMNVVKKSTLWYGLIIFTGLILSFAGGCGVERLENAVKDFENAVQDVVDIGKSVVQKSGTDVFPEDTADQSDDAYEHKKASTFGYQTEAAVSNVNIPSYSGDPFVYVNGNVPMFAESEITTNSYEFYSELDPLGRCGYAMACVGSDLLPTEDREDISEIHPSGWAQEKYDFVDEGWLYNRCHLIAYSLTGENANEKNLITGTRYMNMEGMWPIEETVLYYIKENPSNHVMYRVTPVFEGDNLLASGVLMEGKSVENDDVCFCVFCYNVQPNVAINYATGESFPE